MGNISEVVKNKYFWKSFLVPLVALFVGLWGIISIVEAAFGTAITELDPAMLITTFVVSFVYYKYVCKELDDAYLYAQSRKYLTSKFEKQEEK